MSEEKEDLRPRRRSSRQRQERADKLLINIAVGFLVVLLLSQCFLLSNRTRHFFSMVDRMEGEQILFSANSDDSYGDNLNTGENNSLNRMDELVGKWLLAVDLWRNIQKQISNTP